MDWRTTTTTTTTWRKRLRTPAVLQRDAQNPFPSLQCLTGTLRRVLALLLLASACARRRCNYREILGSYRQVIYVELQNLNLTGSLNSAKVRDPCPSGKAHRVLVSIYGMTQQVRCQRRGRQPSDLEKPLASMEHLILHNCSPADLGKTVSCSDVQRTRGKKRKRNRLIAVINALISCWQKLHSVSLISK